MENISALQFPKVYWKSRGATQAFAGWGEDPHGEVSFGGQAFSPEACQGVWSPFPSSFFFSPKTLIQETWTPGVLGFCLPRLLRRDDTPSKEDWILQVKDATHKIGQGDFEKVVLARQTTLTLEAPVNPTEVLRLLNPLGKEASLFMLQISPEITFLGASPEKLFHRKDRTLSSEALAGTKNLSDSWTAKEFAEITPVQKFLNDKFHLCCDKFSWLPPQEKTFGHLTHLYQGIEGVLKDDISDSTLLTHLHPTPALGGFPRKEALHYLSQVEPIHRGWYGSPFGLTSGLISPSETDMAVAIRSALICGSKMHLFAGAGITALSNPELEWEELDKKIAHFLRYL